jgi:hypothetical protein
MLERERESWNVSERLAEKKERVWREREKHMNGFKVKKKRVKKNNYLQVEFLG